MFKEKESNTEQCLQHIICASCTAMSQMFVLDSYVFHLWQAVVSNLNWNLYWVLKTCHTKIYLKNWHSLLQIDLCRKASEWLK